jgi:hypothetical protein
MRNIFLFFCTGKYSIAAPAPCCSNHSHGHAVHELASGGSGSNSNNSCDNHLTGGIASPSPTSGAASSVSNNGIAFGASYGNREDKDHVV